MSTIEELVVKARPEGLDETSQGFEQMEEDLNAAGEEMSETTDSLEGLQSRWMGAMGAIVAGLGVAAAGLLSQVPVLGEAMSGLGAIIDGVAYQMDQVLRPAITPLTNLFYDMSAAIFEADGAMGDVIGVVGTLGTLVAGAVGGFLSWITATQGLSGLLATLSGWASTLAAGIKAAVSAIAGFLSGSLAAAGALGALIGTLGVMVLEVTGVLDWFQRLGSFVSSILPAQVRDGLMLLLAPLATVGAAIRGFVQGVLEGGLSEGFDQALNSAKTMLGQLEDAWDRTIERISGWIDGFVQTIQGIASNPVVSGAIDMATGGGGGGGSRSFGAQRNGGYNIYLDGRRLTEDTGRYRSDQTTRRGRGP